MAKRTQQKDPFSFHLENNDINHEKNKARALKSSEWWKRKKAKGFCYYCKKSIPPQELTMDHIVPISRGGKTVKNNVVPACKACNNNKKSMLSIEWEAYIKKNSTDPQ